MKRRDFLARASVFGGALMGGQALALVDGGQLRAAGPVWDSWKAAFLQSDGRVVDGLQQQASHSEGQGYGMLAATLFKDEAAFRLMLNWTERHLAIRPDPLLAWRWLPGEATPVPDRNNASDGDLFYAWALVRAAQRFDNRSYLTRATEIAQQLAANCVVAMPGASDRTVWLPASVGFPMRPMSRSTRPITCRWPCAKWLPRPASHAGRLRPTWRGVAERYRRRRVGARLGRYRAAPLSPRAPCRPTQATKRCVCRCS
jgi:endo-1,4-beta-D-glucanase Y